MKGKNKWIATRSRLGDAEDVDEDEEGTQSIKRVPDYDIEVDFSLLDEDDREV